MASETTERSGSLSGLTADEAREFHKAFMQGFLMFLGLSLIAHILVAVLWRWPWFPNPDGTYGSIGESATYAATLISHMFG